MKHQLSQKETTILVAVIMVILLTILGGYFLYLSPKKQEIVNKETQLKNAQQLLATLKGKQVVKEIPTVESLAAIQKKLPVKQQLEQLILDIEKAEVVSGSLVSNMSFSESDVVVPEENTQQQTNSESANQTNGTEQQNNQQGSESTNKTESETEGPKLPEGVKKVIINLSVTSPGYFELMKFLETLESLNRLIVIESVTFAGGAELTNVENKQEEISYSLTFSAFYMPELEDLQEFLPQLVTPEPGNKTNPFTTNADLPGDN